MSFEDRVRASSFGDDAEQYDRSRPGYPPELIDRLLVDGPRLAVDAGCGTGIVARLLIDRGCAVVGVEPDERMAEVARRKGIDVEISTFEAWDGAGRQFDLLVAGQAWHWVDPASGARKAAEVLRPGGRFAVFWNGLRHSAPVAEGFDRVYSRLAPHLLVDSVALGTAAPARDSDAAAFEATGCFAHLEQFEYEWERRYTAEEWLDELPTHSGHRVLDGDVLGSILNEVAQLLDDLGGELVVSYRTAGITGVRV